MFIRTFSDFVTQVLKEYGKDNRLNAAAHVIVKAFKNKL